MIRHNLLTNILDRFLHPILEANDSWARYLYVSKRYKDVDTLNRGYNNGSVRAWSWYNCTLFSFPTEPIAMVFERCDKLVENKWWTRAIIAVQTTYIQYSNGCPVASRFGPMYSLACGLNTSRKSKIVLPWVTSTNYPLRYYPQSLTQLLLQRSMVFPAICKTLRAVASFYPVATAQLLHAIPFLIWWSCWVQDMKQKSSQNRIQRFNSHVGRFFGM